MSFKISKQSDATYLMKINTHSYSSSQLAAASLHLMKETVEVNGPAVIDHLCDDLATALPEQIRLVYFEALCALIDTDPQFSVPPKFKNVTITDKMMDQLSKAIEGCLAMFSSE